MIFVCRLDELPEGSSREFNLQGTAIFLVNHQGKIRAFRNWCPHWGVELNLLPDAFFDRDRRHLICSNHGALFEPDSGHCIAGPCCGDDLLALPLTIRDGGIWLAADKPSA